ncbi:Fic/DOC family protein [Microbacterium sp. ZW T5_45]|uniref:Fic/DOC family protein n=1 Tax=Microbacterium sp. ZW T5_45 TaxID=3378080 RepID=UPI003855041E
MSSQFPTWDSYLWEPGGNVLRNLFWERDRFALSQREYAETAKQQTFIELGLTQIPRTDDADHLRSIHKALFHNVYEWAGEYRTVGISKPPTHFAAPADISQYLEIAQGLIAGADWPSMDREQFAHTTAEVFAYVNLAHPFREGNGRTSKLFMQHVAEKSPFQIRYAPEISGVTAQIWNQASMMSAPDLGGWKPHPESLVPIFRALAVERNPQQRIERNQTQGERPAEGRSRDATRQRLSDRIKAESGRDVPRNRRDPRGRPPERGQGR